MDSSDICLITIDGGAASGKTSTARCLAKQLDGLYVDTGAHYRAVSSLLLQEGLKPDQPEAIARRLKAVAISAVVMGRQLCVQLNGHRISRAALRCADVTAHVSAYAALPEIRQGLLAYQRSLAAFAAEQGFNTLIIEGRDVGSVIFPQAAYKFFLEADSRIRVQRRSQEGFADAVQDRDQQDSRRRAAPLTCPEGAVRINTGLVTLEAVVANICRIIRQAPHAPRA